MSSRGRDLAMGNRVGLEPDVGAGARVIQSVPGPGELSSCPVSPGPLLFSAGRCCAAHPGYDTNSQ